MIVAAVVLIATIAAVVLLATILGRRWHCCGSCGGNLLVPAGLWDLW